MNNVPQPDDSKPVAAEPGGVSRLGEYETLGVLGQGGFSIVHKARDSALGRTIAVKEYMPSAIAHRLPNGMVKPKAPEYQQAFQAGLDSFLYEARLLAQFTHPALVHVYSVWEGNGTAYMAMQYCVGKTLDQICQQEPAKVKDEGWLKATFAPILDALELLHANNCFHRDISPDNILLLNGGGPILLDFGAARQIVGGMTQALTVVLKPGFAPIEQYADDASVRQGPWTDVYGVGAVLYYLVTGKPPLAAVARVVKDPMAKLADSQELAGVSRSFRQAIDDALAVQSNERILSIAQLRLALQLPASQPLGRFSQSADGHAEVGQADPGQALAGADVPALQPSGSALEAGDKPAGTALETTVEAAPTAPEEERPPDRPDSVPPDEPAFDLEASPAIPDTIPEEEPSPDSPSSVLPEDGAPAPPAGVSWAPVFSHLGQSTRITAKALKQNAALMLKSIGRSSWLRNAAALGMAVAVGFASAYGLLHKSAPEGAGASSLASSLAQPSANSPANTATASSQMGGQAATAQGEPPQADTVATLAPAATALPKADGGPPITAGPVSAPYPTSLVHLSIKPWGQIAVDGQSQGVSPPMTSLSLTPGQHLILVTHGDSPPVYLPVTVPEGKDIVVSYQFE